ncbi:MAG: type II methionyl aminopeptidase [Promethearchaeota archaeon]
MEDIIVEKYIKAGKAVKAAKELARKLAKPGIPFLEIGTQCEEKILEEGCELAFPINMSLNEIAAHYSPPIGDITVVPEKGLLKIDLGAHFDGYIADSAITINIDEDPRLQNYVDAAKEALDAAIEIFAPGVRLYELGERISKVITSYGLNPIKNLGGHELKQYNLHAGPFIPNFKDKHHDYKLKPGDAFACEPFTTSGKGFVINGKKAFIYRLKKKLKKNLTYEEIGYMNKIEKETKKLPFSPRLLLKKNIIPQEKINQIINTFVRKNILDSYSILIEQDRTYVAQEEHTIIIDKDGKTIVTTR